MTEECKHEYCYGGERYAVSPYSNSGGSGKNVYYSQWFFCKFCLQDTFKGTTVDGTQYDIKNRHPNATPGGPLPESAKSRY